MSTWSFEVESVGPDPVDPDALCRLVSGLAQDLGLRAVLAEPTDDYEAEERAALQEAGV